MPTAMPRQLPLRKSRHLLTPDLETAFALVTVIFVKDSAK
jgi:hypothetical protein